jgi:histidyl-tRNA synthetase
MTSRDTIFGPPRGMRDFYPEDMAVRNAICDAWRDAAARFGFSPYDACVVESLELLKRKAGEEIVDQIYAFTDKSGRELALRPEMTPTLARMIAARQGRLPLPLKWYTIAQCFRYERTTRGRKREHYQWNLDILGEPAVAAEVEVLSAALCAAAQLGLGPQDLQVHYSSRALLAELLSALGIPPGHHPATLLALDKRGKMDDAEITALLEAQGLDQATITRAFALFDIRSPADAADMLGNDTPALRDLRAFQDLAAAAGIARQLVFDIAVVRGLAYYTGIVFEAFDTARELRAVFGGGRYDNLLADVGGRPMTGVGLGFGDVVIAELLAARGRLAPSAPVFDVAVGFMKPPQHAAAAALAAALRGEGLTVDLALQPEKPKAFFARAGRGQFREAAYVGPDDVAGGAARLKNLSTRAERTVRLPRPEAPGSTAGS